MTPLVKGTPEYDYFYRVGQTNDKGQVICGSHRAKSHEPCQSVFINTRNGRCVKHGGASLVGPAHPKYTTGKRSRYWQDVPARFHETLERMEADQERLDLTSELDIARTRVAELMGRLQSGLSQDVGKRLKRSWNKFRAASATKDEKGITEAFTEIESALREIQNDYAAWGDLERWLARVQTLTESQRRYELEQGYLIQVEQVNAVFNLLKEKLVERLGPDAFRRYKNPRQLLSDLAGDLAIIEGTFVELPNGEDQG